MFLFLIQGDPLTDDYSEQKLTYCTDPKPHLPHYCPNGHPLYCCLDCDPKVEPFCWAGHTENKGWCSGHRPVNVVMADRDLKRYRGQFFKLRSYKHSPLNLVARLGNYSEEHVKAIKGGKPIVRDRVVMPPPYRPSPVSQERLFSDSVQNFPPLPNAAKPSTSAEGKESNCFTG